MNILIATDLISRGMDYNNVAYVILFNLPRAGADWVHRVGRTGRAGSKGTSISFCTGEDLACLDQIRDILKNTVSLGASYPSTFDSVYDQCLNDQGRYNYGSNNRNFNTQRPYPPNNQGYTKWTDYGRGSNNYRNDWSRNNEGPGSRFNNGLRYNRYDTNNRYRGGANRYQGNYNGTSYNETADNEKNTDWTEECKWNEDPETVKWEDASSSNIANPEHVLTTAAESN